MVDKALVGELRMDSDAVLADTPIRSASILVLTFSSDHSWAVQMTLRYPGRPWSGREGYRSDSQLQSLGNGHLIWGCEGPPSGEP